MFSLGALGIKGFTGQCCLNKYILFASILQFMLFCCKFGFGIISAISGKFLD